MQNSMRDKDWYVQDSFKIACKSAQSCNLLNGFLKSEHTFWVDITQNIHRLHFSLSVSVSYQVVFLAALLLYESELLL